MLNLLPRQPAGPVPAVLRATRDVLFRDAWDHDDIAEYQDVIIEVSALVVRLRQMAATCSRPDPILKVAEAIEDAAYPLEREAHTWDDDRDARRHGNRLDNSRAWHSSDVRAAE